MRKIFCKLEKFLCKKYRNEKPLWKPMLTDTQLSSIEEPQAKLIYDSAKEALQSMADSTDYITEKAHILFKYLFTIISATFGIYFYQAGSISIGFVILVSVALLPPILIYAFQFLCPKPFKGKHNRPSLTITPRCLAPLSVFYLCESIDIETIAIPYNIDILNKKASALRRMVLLSLLPLLILLIYISQHS